MASLNTLIQKYTLIQNFDPRIK